MNITGIELLQVGVVYFGSGSINILIGYALQPRGISRSTVDTQKAHFLMILSGPVGLVYTFHIVARYYWRKWLSKR